MAEIDIERKQTTAWPWILLGLLVLALLAWWLLGHRDTDDRTAAVTPAAQVTDTTGYVTAPGAATGVATGAAAAGGTAVAAGTMADSGVIAAPGTPAVPSANVPAPNVSAGAAGVGNAGAARVNGAAVTGALARGVTPGDAVQSFIKFDRDQRALAGADTTHEYTADGLRRLAVALGAINERDAAHSSTLRPRLTALLNRANELEKNPGSMRHADYTRAAFLDAASVMSMLQQQSFPTLQNDVAQVKQAATSIQPNMPLLQQKGAVQKFFDSSADAVSAMAK